jgi:hypothetical protein
MQQINDLHKYQIGGLPIFDVIATLAGAYIASKFLHISMIFAFIVILIIGVFLHIYYDINTPFTGFVKAKLKQLKTMYNSTSASV